MTTGAIIAIDQDRPGPSVSAGSPGVARNDLWIGHALNPRCTTSTNPGGFLWTLLDKPASSTATLSNTTLSTCTFTPDVAGSYRLQLQTNGGGPGNVQILICGVTKDSSGATTRRGWLIPAFGESPAEDNFLGQLRGWAASLEFILNDIITNGFSGGGGGSPTGSAGGSLGGTYPNPSVVQLDGTGGTAAITAATQVSITAPKTVVGARGTSPVTSVIAELTTTDASGHQVLAYQMPPDSTADVLITAIGRNTGGTGGTSGDVFRADLRGFFKRVGSADSALVGLTPAMVNVASDSDLSSCSVDLAQAGSGYFSTSATGIAGRTIAWSFTVQIQERR